MIDDMGSKILKALLPIMEDKKVTNNRLSREKAAKRQSFVQSSVFGQMEVDMNEDEPELLVKGSYLYNAAKSEP
jgi:MoxR-like ATPase